MNNTKDLILFHFMKIITKIVIVLALFFHFCDNKDGINKSVDYEIKVIDSLKTFIPKKIKYSKVGILIDTIQVDLIESRDDCNFLSFGKTASYFLAGYNDDTLRIISPCHIPKINDSIEYFLLELHNTATFIPTKPMLYKYTFPSYGNTKDFIDTAKINTIFGKPIYNIRKIPENLSECLIELDSILSGRMKSEIKVDTVSFHFGLAMWVRNNWGLWSGSNLKNYFISTGVTHPDNMSGIILNEYKKHLLEIREIE